MDFTVEDARRIVENSKREDVSYYIDLIKLVAKEGKEEMDSDRLYCDAKAQEELERRGFKICIHNPFGMNNNYVTISWK